MKENEFGFAVCLNETGTGPGAVRIPLAMLGHWVKSKQKFAITRQTMADIVANFRKRKADTVIDYDHASEYPEDAQGGPIPAAGWIKSVEDAPDADGVLYGTAEFTERAQAMIAKKEYRYISPVIQWGARDKRTGEAQGATLACAGLTNRPFLDTMPAIALSDREWTELETDRVDAVTEQKEVRIVKVILADRGARTVRVEADDGSTSTLVVEGLDPEPKVLRLSDVKRTAEGTWDFATLAELPGGTLVAGEVLHAIRVQTELDEAVRTGTITPAQRPSFERIALHDIAAFRDIVKTLPKQVDLTERGLGGERGVHSPGEGRQATDESLVALAKTRAKEMGVPFEEGLRLAASERPELLRRRNAGMAGERD
jgi:Mu-like prophage I protein